MKINKEEILALFEYLPGDYNSSVLKQYPELGSASNVSQIKKRAQSGNTKMHGKTLKVVAYMMKLARENKETIEGIYGKQS